MMHDGDSLDRRYVEFVDRTAEVFTRFPRLEPLRHFLFRDLVIQRRGSGVLSGLKHVMQRLWQGQKTVGVQEQSDVLIWVESTRDVIVDTLLPVYRELVARGSKVQLVSFGGPRDLPPCAVSFQHRPSLVAPVWTRQAWDSLCLTVEEVHGRNSYRSFTHACAVVEGLFGAVQRLLDTVRPKLVLCAATNFIGGAAVTMASRENGSRPILLQHGMTQAFYTPLISEYMMTWGPSSNSTLANLGVPTNRLLALGSPRHDSIRPPSNGEARQAFLRALALPDRPTFVFFSNGNDLMRNGNAPLECARWLEEVAVAQEHSWNIVSRLHPNEDGRIYSKCSHVSVTKDFPDLSTTLAGCDVVGSLCSTVLYDALLYKKPVLQLYEDGWPELADNWRNQYSMRVVSSAHLNEVLSRLRPGKKEYTDVIREQEQQVPSVFANRGSAGKAIADYVIQNI